MRRRPRYNHGEHNWCDVGNAAGDVAMLLPGWDSFESAKSLNVSFHVAALALVALLALSELMAFVYAGRRDTLAELRDNVTEFNRKKEIGDLERRHASEIGSLNSQLVESQYRRAEAERLVEELRRKQTYRHLTIEQKETLVRALAPYHGYKVVVVCILGDSEGREYADDFVTVFAKAGWDYGGGSGVNQKSFGTDPVGIEMTLNTFQVTSGRIPKAAQVLGETLNSLGLDVKGFRSPDVQPNTIEIRIGRNFLAAR